MAHTHSSSLRPIALALALTLGSAAAAAATPHGDHPAPAAKPAPAAAAKPSAAPAAPAASAAATPAASVPQDPLARVQQRLASRFGAQTAAEPGKAGQSPVVQVVSKSAAAPPAAHPGDAVLGASSKAPARPRRAAAAPHAPAGHELHWAYEGEGGPSAWGQLKPEFSACAVGKRQSPIDIRDGVKLGLEPVHFDYKPSSFKVIDNGHTIQVEVGPGNGVEVHGQRYELLQFHFHRPSEEAIDGRRFDMVAHFVHKSLEGKLAVVAVLLERGAAQAQLQQVWNHLPLEKGDAIAARVTLDLAQLLPPQRGYFTYMGSLTTPPCSEGVLWMVMKQPVQVSPEQVGVFSRLYPNNARPIQSAAGRLIKESN